MILTGARSIARNDGTRVGAMVVTRYAAPASSRAGETPRAVTATPPFGPFFSELRVIRVALGTGHGAAMAMFLGCLLLAFFGITRVVFAIVDGRPKRSTQAGVARLVESTGIILPPLIFLGLSLWLGLFTPRVLQDAWSAAALQLFPVP